MESSGEFSVPVAVLEKLMEREDNNTRDHVVFNVTFHMLQKGRKIFISMEVLWKDLTGAIIQISK